MNEVKAMKYDGKKIQVIWEDESKTIRSLKSEETVHQDLKDALSSLEKVIAAHMEFDESRLCTLGIETKEEDGMIYYQLRGILFSVGIGTNTPIKTGWIRVPIFLEGEEDADDEPLGFKIFTPKEAESCRKLLLEASEYIDGKRGQIPGELNLG